MESLLDKPAGPASLEKFFDPTSGGGDLVKILLSIAAPQTAHSPQYGTRVLRFFNRIFAAGKFVEESIFVIWKPLRMGTFH